MDDIPDLVEELPDNYNYQHKEDVAELPTNIDKRIPVTIITGYLGSGKSTLLERISKNAQGKRLAIILNEFGDSAVIEKSVTLKDESKSVQEWLDLGNGCLCCTVKDNGVLAIERLVEKSRGKIDYILLETTGIADPVPIAKMFWLDEGLASSIYIDGVVTVVDSQHIVTCLDDVGGHWHRENHHTKRDQGVDEEEEPEGVTTAHLQIAMADVVLMNKADKLENSPQAMSAAEERVRSVNSTAPIYQTSFGDIDLNKILDLHAFEATNVLQSYKPGSFHDDRITTTTLDFPFFTRRDQFDEVEKFLQYVLWESQVNGKPVEIHRLKGLLVYQGSDGNEVKVVQGVRDTYDVQEGTLLPGVETNKLVFIGKSLDVDDLRTELDRFVKK
ncbi:zinc-regulated GTPase metalloprotein activator 1 [Diutina catenulata]